jgi:hypothetical protein
MTLIARHVRKRKPNRLVIIHTRWHPAKRRFLAAAGNFFRQHVPIDCHGQRLPELRIIPEWLPGQVQTVIIDAEVRRQAQLIRPLFPYGRERFGRHRGSHIELTCAVAVELDLRLGRHEMMHLVDRRAGVIPVVLVPAQAYDRTEFPGVEFVGAIRQQVPRLRKSVAMLLDRSGMYRKGARVGQQAQKIGCRIGQANAEMKLARRFDAEALRRLVACNNSRCVFDVRQGLRIKCRRRRIDESSKAVNEMLGRDGFAIRPARLRSQPEIVLPAIVRHLPALGRSRDQFAVCRITSQPLADIAEHVGRLNAS